MLRNPSNNFHVRKRKWKTVLFLLRKRKRKTEIVRDDVVDDVANVVRNDDDVANVVRNDDEKFEGFGNRNPRLLGLGGNDHNDDVDVDDDVDEVYEDARIDDVDENSNPRLLGLNDDEESLKTSALGEGKKDERGFGDNNNNEEEESAKPGALVVVGTERKKDGGDKPPDDDCCPICFETFNVACKTNCGHWFCANCILQFWTYRTVLQKCNCPICARPISKLTPEASLLTLHEVEVVEVLKNVQRYNRLFQGGINGVIRKVFEVPNVFKRMLCGLMDPDRFRGNYYAMRSFALLMSCIYNISSFDFIPTGTLGVRRLFDLCAIALVVILCLVGVCHRLVLRRRVRRLAANQL